MLAVNGWQLYAHPEFLDQLERLIAAAEADRARQPSAFAARPNAKVLAAIRKLAFETIATDPTRAEYRQGGTLGASRRHWFRATFGGQRFRLFFRYDSRAKVIIHAWVNDSETLRTYGARTDDYAVFKGMLESGSPPDDWTDLLASASGPAARKRFVASAQPGADASHGGRTRGRKRRG